mmetsp:Transcript_3773/g.3513  ORF Transcript_3773/g.3513 Transcript_3773/m.3513 type:complete len:113 (+) Transcript_3773:301-639(+)
MPEIHIQPKYQILTNNGNKRCLSGEMNRDELKITVNYLSKIRPKEEVVSPSDSRNCKNKSLIQSEQCSEKGDIKVTKTAFTKVEPKNKNTPNRPLKATDILGYKRFNRILET